MSNLQIACAIALAGLAVWRGGFAVWCLIANMAAFLVVCVAMDDGKLDRDAATVWFAVIDFATGSALATKPGLARLVAAGYAIKVPIYALNVVFGVSTDTTFALVWAIVALQLGVLAIGTSGHHGSGGRRRLHFIPVSLFSLGRTSGRGDVGGAQFSRRSEVGGAQGIALFSGRE